MKTMMNVWLSVWLYVMAGIAVSLAVLVGKNRKTWTKLQCLCTLAVIVLVLHVLEEWVFPGGLHYSYNIDHGSSVLSCYPMNRLTDMITNFGGVLLGCIVLKGWGFRKPAGIAVMLFSAFEVVIHVVIGVTSLRTFSEYGMDLLYSPGLVTALFGFLPVALLLAKELFAKGRCPTAKQWGMAVGAMFLFCFLLINLPELILRDENSPYAFTNRGYYERYGAAYEAEHGAIYEQEGAHGVTVVTSCAPLSLIRSAASPGR